MDISSRADIEVLVQKFYAKAMKDPLIAHFFTTAVSLDLEKHLISSVTFGKALFWEI